MELPVMNIQTIIFFEMEKAELFPAFVATLRALSQGGVNVPSEEELVVEWRSPEAVNNCYWFGSLPVLIATLCYLPPGAANERLCG
jgi:hypothetical protein